MSVAFIFQYSPSTSSGHMFRKDPVDNSSSIVVGGGIKYHQVGLSGNYHLKVL